MRALAWLAVGPVLALAACGPATVAETLAPPAVAVQAAPKAPAPDAPLPNLVAKAADAVTTINEDAVDAVQDVIGRPDNQPPPPPLVDPVAVALIVKYEVISPAYFQRRLIRPIYPGGASGVTWCIGYDGGHQGRQVIAQDWFEHPDVLRLATTAGITGNAAKAILSQYRDIVTEYPYCQRVFSDRTLIEYERRTARLFRNGYDSLRPKAKGALVSLVYNRGASTSGDNRREIKAMVEDCVPRQDYSCIAQQNRASKRLWKGSSIQDGMYRRREEESVLIETP